MRWLIRAAVGAVVLVLVVAGTFVKLIVFPTVQQPGPTDVIVVLGPNFSSQEAEARVAVRASPGAEVLYSWYASSGCPPVNGREQCFRPVPYTTEGEARFASTYAKAHGAASITVVAPEYQISRARLWFGRCWSRRLTVVSARWTLAQRIHMIPYQTAATVKAEVFERRC